MLGHIWRLVFGWNWSGQNRRTGHGLPALFWNEAGLILDGETIEEAFQHHRNDNDSLNMHHNNLQNLLGAEKKINGRKFKTQEKIRVLEKEKRPR